jgi:putative flavoprotein involved in K+ transport
MWTRTPQKGLWFHAGSLPQCRIFSRILALQIKACEEGLLPLEMTQAAALHQSVSGRQTAL